MPNFKIDISYDGTDFFGWPLLFPISEFGVWDMEEFGLCMK